MPRAKSVITINFKPPASRWLLLLPALLALVFAWFAGRWYVGNVVAEYAPPPDQGGVEMAEVAVRWAPDDPLTHWRLASYQEKNFSVENLAAAVQQYQLAVKASPYDYRYWMELGKAFEAAGDRDSSEKAARRAVELAPNYSHPLWQYGNVLLRQGKIPEAFTQLAKAVDNDGLMRAPVFELASQIFGNDLDQFLKAFSTPSVRIYLAVYLINSNRFDQAAQVLHTISAAERKTNAKAVDDIIGSLIEKKQFHSALALLGEIEPDPSQLPQPGKIWNGDFEQVIQPLDAKPFHWLINSRPSAQISVDTVAHSGKGSLKIVFAAPNKLERIPISQTIVVEPDTQYKVQFYQRTDKLVSASNPVISVADSVSNEVLAVSAPAASGSNDWELVTLEFKTKPNSDGVSIGLFRNACDKQVICPIFGTVWYDDFDLQRVGGPSPANRNSSAGKK